MKNFTTSIFLIVSFLFSQAQNCFDFASVPPGTYGDNVLYPAGSVILSSNDIDIIKPAETFGIFPMNGFDVVNVDSSGIYFVNQLDLDISNVSYSCKELSFELFYNGFAVDGDTVSFGSFALPPLPYNGPGFTVDTVSNNVYTVNGTFDMIHIFGSTSILSNLCLDECASGGCFQFPNAPTGPYSDNALYPAGSVILSSNDIDIIKPAETFGIFPMNGFDVVNVDSSGIYFVNQLDLDISNVSYSCKELSFELFYNGFAVDGDTVSFGSFALPPLPYNGPGFTVDTVSNNVYTVNGTFDMIHIFGSTSMLHDICIGPCAATEVSEKGISSPIKVYPNPSTGLVNISNIPDNSRVLVYSISGQLIHEEYANTDRLLINLSDQETGTYIIHINAKSKIYHSKWIKY